MQPIPFLQFVQDNGGRIEEARSLPSEFYVAPNKMYFPENDYANKKYNGQNPSGAVSALFQKILSPFYFEFHPVKLIIYNQFMEAFGFAPNQEREGAMKTFLYNRAATYQFCKEGACSWRCAYAAMKLAQIFRDVASVFLQSNPEKDQFVVVLGTKDKKWFVFDPLTNSDLIFPYQFYTKNVLPTFPKVKHQAQEFKLKISPSMADDYEKRWPKIEKALLDLCEKNKPTTESLTNDPNYRISLLLAGYSKEEIPKTCEKVIEEFKRIMNEKGALFEAK